MTITTLLIISLSISIVLLIVAVVLLVLSLKMIAKIKQKKWEIDNAMDYDLDEGVYHFQWESECLN